MSIYTNKVAVITGAGSGMESLLGRGEGAEPNHWLTDLIKLDKNDTGLMFP